MPLHNLQSSGFYFSSEEAYLLLLIYKSGCEGTFKYLIILLIAESDLATFPHSLWGVVESAENLTPRGLSNTFSTNEQEPLFNHSLDSFLLSRRRDEVDEESKSSGKKGQSATT